MGTLVSLITWGIALFLVLVTVLLLLQKQSGLKLLQHRVELLPQAMLVRYLGAAMLALIAAWMDAPRMLFATLLMVAIVAFGDAFIYRRAGHPHWMHLAVGGASLVGALFALFSIGGAA